MTAKGAGTDGSERMQGSYTKALACHVACELIYTGLCLCTHHFLKPELRFSLGRHMPPALVLRLRKRVRSSHILDRRTPYSLTRYRFLLACRYCREASQ